MWLEYERLKKQLPEELTEAEYIAEIKRITKFIEDKYENNTNKKNL